jgi:CopG family transcriptional regulator/antitoxin EndoAI
MYRRINITLPEETVQLIDRIVPKGDRSHFINEALKYIITQPATQSCRASVHSHLTHELDGLR